MQEGRHRPLSAKSPPTRTARKQARRRRSWRTLRALAPDEPDPFEQILDGRQVGSRFHRPAEDDLAPSVRNDDPAAGEALDRIGRDHESRLFGGEARLAPQQLRGVLLVARAPIQQSHEHEAPALPQLSVADASAVARRHLEMRHEIASANRRPAGPAYLHRPAGGSTAPAPVSAGPRAIPPTVATWTPAGADGG